MSLVTLVLRTGAAQLLVQALGFVGGLLVVRLLPVSEYATYTLLVTALGTLTSLADAGIAGAVLACAGRAHGDRAHVSRAIATGLRYRRHFSLVLAVVALPLLAVVMLRQGAGLMVVVTGSIAIALLLAPMAATAVLEVPLKLQQSVLPLQRAQLQANALRVMLVTLALWCWPLAPLALACAALAQAWLNHRLRRLLQPLLEPATVDPGIAAEVRRIMRRTLPGTLYYCFAGQLSVWLLALFGNAVAVAQVGALGRLAMLFTVLQSVVALIVLPRFARLPPAPALLRAWYFRIGGALLFLVLSLTAAAAACPGPLLWLLGRDYSSLHVELALTMLASALAFVAGTLAALNGVRGWLPPGWVPPALGLSHTAALMWWLDVGTVLGVLQMQALLAAFGIVYTTLTFLWFHKRDPHVDTVHRDP